MIAPEKLMCTPLDLCSIVASIIPDVEQNRCERAAVSGATGIVRMVVPRGAEVGIVALEVVTMGTPPTQTQTAIISQAVDQRALPLPKSHRRRIPPSLSLSTRELAGATFTLELPHPGASEATLDHSLWPTSPCSDDFPVIPAVLRPCLLCKRRWE